MPGGKGNIKPEDGKQFSSDYQPDKEIWTEEVAVKFCNDLLTWLENDENIFYEKFIYMIANPLDYHEKAKIYNELPAYLAKKFTSCLKLLERAKKIQEVKLYDLGVLDKLNPSMTKFVLINEHGKLSDNSKVNQTGSAINYNVPVSKEEAKQISDDIEDEV